jgi:hypothetical protein
MLATILSLSLLTQTPAVPSSAREDLTELSARRLRLNRRSMFTLGGWAVANMAAGGIGWGLATDTRARAFWQGTLIWNTVNLGLAVVALIMTRNEDPAALDLKASLDQGDTYQKLFLFNGALDVAYLVTAGLLLEHGKRTGDPQWVGYGNALLVQAGFLLVFDFALFFLHRSVDRAILDRLTVTPNGLGLSF